MKNFIQNNIVTNSIGAAMVLLLIAPVVSAHSAQMSRGGSAPTRTASAPARSAAPASHGSPRSSASPSNNGSTRGKSSFAAPHVNPGRQTASNSGSVRGKSSGTAHVEPGRQVGSNSGSVRGKSSGTAHVEPGRPTGSNSAGVHGKSSATPHVEPGRQTASSHGHDRFPQGHDSHTREGRDFVERSRFESHGHEFVERAYFHHGEEFHSFYRPFVFGGVEFAAYTPVRFFAPGFYAWAYNPWFAPVHYRWDWFGAPWFRFYSSYFTPYPVYSSASLWLTDYAVASSLQEAYPQAAATACMPCAGYRAGLTPAVKGLLGFEIRRQIALESAEANGTVATAAPAFLDGSSHVFLASASMTVNAGGQQCSLNSGDVLQLSGPAAIRGTDATLQVLASQGQDCALGSYVSLPLDQLQEMQNHLRETIDQGFAQLRTRNGQGGLPVAPAAAMTAPVSAPFVAQVPAAENCPSNGGE